MKFMPAAELTLREGRIIDSIDGWLMLGSPSEALMEFGRLSPVGASHPRSLDARWRIAAAMRDWDSALEAAVQLQQVAPDDPAGWIHRSYAIRRHKLGGLHKAWDALLPAASRFPKVSVIPYNLACYAAQLGQLIDAWDWLHRAIEAAEDIRLIKNQALNDPDLKPIWDRVKGL